MVFEDRWRDLRRDWRTPETILSPARLPRSTLQRIVSGAPEVFVRATGRPKSARALRDHLRYISREASLELQGGRDLATKSRRDLDDLAEAWAFVAARDARGRGETPVALSVVFGLPAGQDPKLVEGASRAFVEREFAGHDYLQVLHTDRPHPHVHAVVRWLGEGGRRLPSHRNAALGWREGFAREVRSRGLEVEASPRWVRGVVRRRHPYALHLMREAAQSGLGAPPKADERLAALARQGLAQDGRKPSALEIAAAKRQLAVRRAFLDHAAELARSGHQEDLAFAQKIEQFLSRMPTPLAPRLEAIRRMEAAHRTPQPRTERERHR